MNIDNDNNLCEKLEWATPKVEKMFFTGTKGGFWAYSYEDNIMNWHTES